MRSFAGWLWNWTRRLRAVHGRDLRARLRDRARYEHPSQIFTDRRPKTGDPGAKTVSSVDRRTTWLDFNYDDGGDRMGSDGQINAARNCRSVAHHSSVNGHTHRGPTWNSCGGSAAISLGPGGFCRLPDF